MATGPGDPPAIVEAFGPQHGQQTVPHSEATALLVYAASLVPGTHGIFHTDCQWVHDSFVSGPSGSTGAMCIHAGLWRQIWRAIRLAPSFVVCKVKAHQSVASLPPGSEQRLKAHGNSLADRAANRGRLLHILPPDAVGNLKLIRQRVRDMGLFLARFENTSRSTCPHDATYHGAERAPPPHRAPRLPASRGHFVHQAGGRWRCIFCLRSNLSRPALVSSRCRAEHSALMHAVWRVGTFLVCHRCGAYSDRRARNLARPCSGRPTQSACVFLDRLRAGLHPVSGEFVAQPQPGSLFLDATMEIGDED